MNQALDLQHRKFIRSFLHSLLFGLLSFLVIVPSLQAAIIPTGNVEPVGTWTSLTDGYVGNTSDGSLLADAGSVLQSYKAYIAYLGGVSGAVTVTGTGSKWDNTSDLYVGNAGAGTLRIEAGGQVSNSSGILGNTFGSSGTATVTGAGSTWTNRFFYVGENGTGTNDAVVPHRSHVRTVLLRHRG